MRILILMDPAIPVPPKHYGGIERVVYDLASEYVKMGHHVTLIAGPNSISPDKIVIYGKNSDTQSIRINFHLLFIVTRILFQLVPKHDVIHNFGRLLWMYPIFTFRIKKVHTYMRYITPSNIKILNQLGVKNITYTAVSDAIKQNGLQGGGRWETVYNCTDISQYTFVNNIGKDAPLFFLGRLERCKGAHTAIEVAIASGRKLIIAGNISPLEDEIRYFEEELKPYFDHPLINYIGPVDNAQKNLLLGSSLAMLLPIEWFEPFPIVIPESYACGTPILAFPGGGVPEGIEHGVTGFICTNLEEMIKYVEEVHLLDRKKCRFKAENEYSSSAIANKYLSIYQS